MTKPAFVIMQRRALPQSGLRRLVGAVAISFSLVGAFGLVDVVGSSATAEAAVPDIGKVAVVDMQRILNDTAAGKKARKDLETASAAKQKKLDKLQKQLEADQAKLAQIKDQQALMQAQEKLQRDYYELQSMYMTLQQELAEQEGRTLEKMYTNCQTLAKELAKDFSLDLVLIRDQSTVLYTASGIDLTDELIKRYDKKFN
jgi:outer membrane protein